MESLRLQVEDCAADWLRRRELGPWGEAQAAQLAQWLEASTANRIAFIRLEAAWEEMGRLKAAAPAFGPRTVPTAEQLELTPLPGVGTAIARPPRARSGRLRYAIAASVLVGCVAAGAWFASSGGSSYQTSVGELTSIPLTDGTQVTLNTASEVRVRISEQRRSVELTRGEAFFEVARDPDRPFSVLAGKERITALGTAFSVRREAGGVRVTVTDGLVSVDRESGSTSDRLAVLDAGSVGEAGAQGMRVQRKQIPEVEEALSWRLGYLVFHDAALTEVVAEFNRYNERELTLSDPAIDRIRLTGKFRSTNVDALVRLLEKSFHIEAREHGGVILLSVRDGAKDAMSKAGT